MDWFDTAELIFKNKPLNDDYEKIKILDLNFYVVKKKHEKISTANWEIYAKYYGKWFSLKEIISRNKIFYTENGWFIKKNKNKMEDYRLDERGIDISFFTTIKNEHVPRGLQAPTRRRKYWERSSCYCASVWWAQAPRFRWARSEESGGTRSARYKFPADLHTARSFLLCSIVPHPLSTSSDRSHNPRSRQSRKWLWGQTRGAGLSVTEGITGTRWFQLSTCFCSSFRQTLRAGHRCSGNGRSFAFHIFLIAFLPGQWPMAARRSVHQLCAPRRGESLLPGNWERNVLAKVLGKWGGISG